MILERITTTGRAILAAIFLVILLASPTVVPAQKPGKGKPAASDKKEKPLEVEINFGGSSRETEDGSVLVEGDVTVTWGDVLFQADRVTYHEEEKYIEAEGNILVVWGLNRISGTSLFYDLEEDRGVITDAIGSLDPDYQFDAEMVEKVGEDLVYLKNARVTTCTQPVPYWSFRVSKARVRIDGYARMWNVRLKAKKVPMLYLPFLLWPVKEGRAPGLLLPEIHTTQSRGRAITLPLFVPLGRSADITLTGTHFSEAGFGTGADLRYIPNQNGELGFSGFYIDDKVDGRERYRATYQQTQSFRNGFRMVADVNVVSDFGFFNDFERELRLTSSPSILARVEFSRNGKWASMNIRELRREQLFSDGSSLVQQTFPEIEWRGRSRKLGKTPFYLSYTSSLASIQQRDKLDRSREPGEYLLDADYLRADLYPTVSIPVSPAPWLDVTPKVSYRLTHYTQSQREFDDGEGGTEERVVDDSITRGIGSFAIEIVGPKLFRIYERPKSKFSKRYKHTLETTASYRYGEDYDEYEDVILYDEVDRFRGGGNTLQYGLRSRLLAKRPRSRPTDQRGTGETILMPGGISSEPPLPGDESSIEDRTGKKAGEEEQLEPVEIATLELRQTRSFEIDLSFADLDGDGVNEAASRSSDIQLIGRLNPTPRFSMDLRGTWHPLYKEVRDVTFAGSLSGDRGRLRFSLVHRNGLGVQQVGFDPETPLFEPNENDTQLQLNAGLNLFGGKLRIDANGAYDANPAEGQKRFGQKQWRVRYSTQCCTFLLERLARGFTADQQRQDFYFRVDLKGVGKILDQHF